MGMGSSGWYREEYDDPLRKALSANQTKQSTISFGKCFYAFKIFLLDVFFFFLIDDSEHVFLASCAEHCFSSMLSGYHGHPWAAKREMGRREQRNKEIIKD